ncbi:MAG: GGDEF domain-containing protein [Acidimicrobiales bacterium]
MSDFEPSVAVRARTSVDPPAARHNRFERWVLHQLARGRARFIGLTSLGIIAASAALTATLIHPAGLAGDGRVVLASGLLAVAVSGLVAPPVVWYLGMLISRLDEMTVALHRAAVTDPLTQVLNRRGFFDAVASVDPGANLWVVAMVDLDDFKILNDTHGHDIGDRVLSFTARWLTGQAGEVGFVGRIGGDEFACVCLELHGGAIQPAPAEVDVDHDSSLTPTLGDGRRRLQVGGVPFSVSIGRAPVTPGESIPDALLRADVALYRAKHRRVDRRRPPSVVRSPVVGSDTGRP